MKLRMNGITGVNASRDGFVYVDCDMNKTQMRDAFMQFCERITDEDAAEWLNAILDNPTPDKPLRAVA